MTNYRPGYLDQGAPLGATLGSTVLTADNQGVVTDSYSMIFLYSDSATASARTFTLAPGTLVGQLVTLVFQSASSFTCELLSTGNCQLRASWTPLQYESINLRWDGTYWLEMNRSKTLVPGQANIGVADLAAAVMVEATGTLSQANITGMNVTPVTLIAAPAAGLAHIIDEVEILHTYSTAAYTNGGDVALQYTTGSTAIILWDKTIVTNASSTTRLAGPTIYDLDSSTGTAIGFDILTVAASAVSITNSVAAFAAGNAANILKYRIRYHTVTLLT